MENLESERQQEYESLAGLGTTTSDRRRWLHDQDKKVIIKMKIQAIASSLEKENGMVRQYHIHSWNVKKSPKIAKNDVD